MWRTSASLLYKKNYSLQPARTITTNEVRKKFTNFFVNNGYEHLPSSSVIPPSRDSSLLFTSAGMVQFKEAILDPSDEQRNIVTIQKCIRAGGKNCDLENVGYSPRHLSFFEMLGFFQLPPASENYKREAIRLAMNFLTKEVGLDPNRLKVTVHQSDLEAKDIWEKDHGKKAYICNSEHNFWTMGVEKGLPCGPCSEIYYDFSESNQIKKGGENVIPPDDENCLEIWNLVFMQYEHNGKQNPVDVWEENEWKKLKGGRCVDTGMGLERLTSVLQNIRNSNFKIDSLQSSIDYVQNILSKILGRDIPYADFTDPGHNIPEIREMSTSIRVIVDHLRCASIMIADGVVPMATGRGYVLRRILRRMFLHGHLLGLKEPSMDLLLPNIIQTLSEPYPEVVEKQFIIKQFIQMEENLFYQTIHQGLKILEDYFYTRSPLFKKEHVTHKVSKDSEKFIQQIHQQDEKSKQISKNHETSEISNETGKEEENKISSNFVFTLYHTMGLPLDLSELYAKKYGLVIDFNQVNQLLEDEREKSRKTFKGLFENNQKGQEITKQFSKSILDISNGIYHNSQRILKTKSKLVEYSYDQSLENEKPKNIYICIDPCPFYPEGGGQIGDKGELIINKAQNKVIPIENAIKLNNATIIVSKFDENHLNLLKEMENNQNKDEKYFIISEVNEEHRLSASRAHTATHLLNATLRNLFGKAKIHQAGSFVGNDRLRFDFTHPNPISKENLQIIERKVREIIRLNAPVQSNIESYQDAINSGAVSLESSNKYSNFVRTIEVKHQIVNELLGNDENGANKEEESICGHLSKELCGGTHVQFTGDIGNFIIINEASISSGIRRIEALTGKLAEEYIDNHVQQAKSVATLLTTPVSNIHNETKSLLDKIKSLDNEINLIFKQSLVSSLQSFYTSGEYQFQNVTSSIQIHYIKSNATVNYQHSKAKGKKLNEVTILKQIGQEISRKQNKHSHLLLKEQNIIYIDNNNNAKEIFPALAQLIGASVAGLTPNFAIGLLPNFFTEQNLNQLKDWIQAKEKK